MRQGQRGEEREEEEKGEEGRDGRRRGEVGRGKREEWWRERRE